MELNFGAREAMVQAGIEDLGARSYFKIKKRNILWQIGVGQSG
jgi:hypothetical protein